MYLNFRKVLLTAAIIMLSGFLLTESFAQENTKDLEKSDSNKTPTPTPVVSTTPAKTTVETNKTENSIFKICTVKPEIKGGTLTAETFLDRLNEYFKSEPEVQIVPLDNVNDVEQAKRRAVAAQCGYLLRTIINGDEKGFKIKGVGNKKYKIAVEYFFERLGDNQLLKNETLEAGDKDAEKAVGEIIGKIASAIFSAVGVGKNPQINRQPLPQSDLSEKMLAPRLVVQTSHASSVSDFSYSSDGKLLATLGSDGIVKIWLVQSRQEILTIPGFDIVGFDFHPNGKQLGCVSKNGVVRIFDVGTGNLIRRFYEIKPPEKKDNFDEVANLLFFNNPVPIAFSPTGNLLVVGKIGGIKIFDVLTGKTSSPITTKDDEAIESLKISPDGKLIAAVIENNKVKIWSLLSKEKVEEFGAGVEEITALAFSQDSNKIAIGSKNGSVKIYFTNGKDGKDFKIFKKIVETNGDKAFRVSDSPVGWIPGVKLVFGIKDLVDNFNQVFNDESIRSVDFSPDGKTLAYQGGNNSIKVVNIENGTELFTVPTENTPAFFEGNAIAKFLISRFFKQLCPVKFSSDGSSLNTCKEFKNIQRWDAKTGKEIDTLAVARRGAKSKLPFPVPYAITSTAYFLNEKTLVTSTLGGGVNLWNLESGSEPEQLLSESGTINVPLSSDGKFYIANLQDGKGIGVFELESRKQIKDFQFTNERVFAATFSPDGQFVAVQLFEVKEKNKKDDKDDKNKKDDKDKDNKKDKKDDKAQKNDFKYRSQKVNLSIREIATGNELRRIENITPNQYSFTPDAKKIAFIPNGKSVVDAYFNKTKIKMMDIATGTEIYKINVRMESANEFTSKIAFSSDGKKFAAEDGDSLKIWDAETGNKIQEVKLSDDQNPFNLAFIPNKNVVTFTTFKGIFNWNIDSNQINRLDITTDYWGKLSYSPTGNILAIGSAENRVRLFDTKNYKEIGSLVSPNEQDWLMVTPEGRFDAAWLEDITEVHWIMPDNLFETQPLEIFMRDYFEPRLLGRTVTGDTFAAIPDLTKRNRAIPKVEITDIVRMEKDTVKVTVTAQNMVSETQRDANGQPKKSGVYSLRLFRSGQLVGYSNESDEISLTTDETGKVTRTFFVKLPNLADQKQVEFSANAFNSEQVKSLTTRKVFDLPADVLPTKGKVYLVTIGANTNEIDKYSLRYAANDARDMQKTISDRIKNTGNFQEIIEIPLISDFTPKKSVVTTKTGNIKTPPSKKKNTNTQPKDIVPQTNTTSTDLTINGEHNAKKAKIKGVIDLLSGRKSAVSLNIPNESRISKAGPNDLVIITFSGHGYADEKGVFYLVPSDLGGTDGKFSSLLGRSVSSNELALWLRDLDAGELMLILDACHAAAFIETGYKPGPMNSRGVGQLAYNKGIKILAATQENNVALESKNLQHGLLSFALVNDGIERNLADYSPLDKIITSSEWLGFGAKRVPILAADLEAKRKDIEATIKVETNNDELLSQKKKRLLQQPKLFNFSRNRKGPILFVNNN